MDDRKFWLTGSSGLLGRSIYARLVEQGLDVFSVTNQQTINYPEIKHGAALNLGNREYIDYSQQSELEKACQRFGVPDVLIHAGWGGMSEPESQIHLKENVANSLTLMRTLYRLGLKRCIFLGTINEYGERGGKLSEEMEPLGKLRNYEAGKRKVGDLGIGEAERQGAVYIHVRVANSFGAPQRTNSLIGTLHQAYNSDEPARLSACENYRDYIHTADVAEGVLRICDVDYSTRVNLGSGKSIRLRNFVEKYWETLGGDEDQLIFGALGPGEDEPEQSKAFMDISKLASLTSWRPALTIEQGIKKTVADMDSYQRQGA